MAHRRIAPLAALAALLCAAAPLPAGAASPPERSCFAACMAQFPTLGDDHYAFADDVRGCRDDCQAKTLETMKADGTYAVYAACTPEPLSKEEFRDLRAGNPSWQAQFNVFTWDLRNVLPDRILTGITVKTQDMNLIDIELTSDAVIPPGAQGTFVVPDFFDGYPAVRYTTKVTSAMACRLD